MKKLFVLLCCVVSLVLFFSSDALAADNYLVFKAGMYSPQSDDLDELEFDDGFNGEFAFGHYFSRNLAGELGFGYYQTKTSASGYLYDYYADVDIDIDVVPLTVALKAIAPLDRAELYALGGFGMYFASVEATLDVHGVGSASDDDDDEAFGGFLGAGVNFDFANQAFFGMECKYHWVEANWKDDLSLKLDGWVITANLGFKY